MAVLNRFGRKTIAELITDICYYEVLIESEKMNALSPYDNSEPLALHAVRLLDDNTKAYRHAEVTSSAERRLAHTGCDLIPHPKTSNWGNLVHDQFISKSQRSGSFHWERES